MAFSVTGGTALLAFDVRMGDSDLDRLVNFADFQKLLDGWNPVGYDGQRAPEPASVLLLALGALAMLRPSRKA